MKKGFVYLIFNSSCAKFGATTNDIKTRVDFYNKKNKDKFKVKSYVISKDIFREENNFRWFLNESGGYYGKEFFPLEKISTFKKFFGDRVVEVQNE